MEQETIHIEANKVSFNFHVFLLFIPAIVFVVIMAFIMRATNSSQTAASQDAFVLGNTNSR